ncbi:MAG: GH3 auxin-responsive promoter family protein, partial [Candidatus Thorarchaeota archaeon]
MSIMSRLVKIIAKRKLKEIEHVLNHPCEMSEETLNAILKRHRDTVLGRKFGFESIDTPEKYSETVPLMDGTIMAPYLESIMENPTGKQLTVDPVIWFLQTSGTTGQPKRLPVTKYGIKKLSSGTMLSWMGYIGQQEENIKLLDGMLVTFGAGSHIDNIGDLPVGYATGVYSQF